MKNFLYVIGLIVVCWLVKLSYDVVQMKNKFIEAQNDLLKNEQTIAHLNDQLVALQRKSLPLSQNQSTQQNQQSKDLQSKDQQSSSNEMVGLNPTVLIKQQLELVKFALQQQQYVYAIEQLNEIDIVVEKNELADTLKLALHRAIAQDKAVIQQYVASRAIQEEQLAEALQLIERSLIVESESSEIKLAKNEEKSWLSRWFSVDPVDQNIPNIVQRKLILKEIQLRMILAQQALVRGEILEYQSMLDLMIAELNGLPDAYSLKLKQRLIKLKQTKMNPMPKLSSLAILES